jgi:hypothetical protein
MRPFSDVRVLGHALLKQALYRNLQQIVGISGI